MKYLAAFLSWLCLLTVPAHALQLTDDRNVTVTFAQSPQRIISLLPSLTESVCAMEQCHRLVGRDRYSNHPAPVRPVAVDRVFTTSGDPDELARLYRIDQPAIVAACRGMLD